MTDKDAFTVVIVPGLRDHVAEHWQTWYAETLDDVRILPPLEPEKHAKLDLEARVSVLEEIVSEAADAAEGRAVVLVAHSAGVPIVVHWADRWANHWASAGRVQAALLATPPDFEVPLPEGYPMARELRAHGWTPLPRRRLPFPTTVAASRNDPLASYRRVAGMAETWGSRLVDLGEVGHLNPASGFGPWPRVDELVADLVDRAARRSGPGDPEEVAHRSSGRAAAAHPYGSELSGQV